MYYDLWSQYIMQNSKKNSFRGNYSRKYGICTFMFWNNFSFLVESWNIILNFTTFLSEAVKASRYYFLKNWLQISKFHKLRHLWNTLYPWKYQFWHLSEPIYFIHFNVRHPVSHNNLKICEILLTLKVLVFWIHQ